MSTHDRQLIEKELDKISYLLIRLRQLLSSIQELKIELARGRGWAISDLFGSMLFAKQVKYARFGKVDSLIKHIELQKEGLKLSLDKQGFRLGLSSANIMADALFDSLIANWIQIRKTNRLSKEVDSYYQ